MKQNQKKLAKKAQKEPLIKPMEMLFGLVVLAYIFIPTFTPNWMSLDTNTPKFFMTAVLNLAVFLSFLFTRYFRNNAHFASSFFTNQIGLIYSAFLFVTLLSFTQSVNMLESVLQFAKVFTVFASVFNLAIILMHDLRYVKLIIVVMAGLLVFDAVSVFGNISKFISGEIKAIADIKTVYSNKNILASAIYVKLPFALWLMVFEKKWLKWLGWIALTFGITATFFMATRAFYLGLLVISIAFIAYNLVVYIRQKEKNALWLMGAYVAALMIAFAAFTFTQSNLYPKAKKSRHTQGVTQQLASIREFDTSTGLRIDAWRWSWELFKEKPLLGVGSGNWKVTILKHENQKNAGFIYLYKAHNDFIEITAETGIFGGLLFLGLFVMIMWRFLHHYYLREEDPEHLHQFLFLAAAGMTFYAVDAFFNFPIDRPEITALFAVFVSTGIAATFRHKEMTISKEIKAETKPGIFSNIFLSAGIITISIVILAASSWILYLNFQSSITQRIVYQEIMGGKLKEPSAKIISGFPRIPDVSVWGESIETLKARYLINEEKNEEAIEVLRKDFSSPWDARREFFMAMAFNSLKEYDSALYYSEIALKLKPNYFRNIQLAASLLERKGENDKVADLYNEFLAKNKKESQAWLYASNFYFKNDDLLKARETIDEGIKYHRKDTLMQKQQRFLHHKLDIEPHLPIFNKASEFYQAKKYAQAVEQMNEFLKLVPDYSNAYQIRSFSYYYLKEYKKSIADADRALELGPVNPSLINLRGVCKLDIKEKEEACKDFKKAMELGDKSGKTNYERFCGQQ
ncbi:MAG: O-antigen ligase family protein [Bacteroidales bacterium]|nr:O-antigen ligase family protein [Bacteroidales bacterium]